MNQYWTNFPGDSEDFKLRGRSYRSEFDILASILHILDTFDERPVKKTRLIQYANLNSRSFAKYMNFLLSSNLVRTVKGGYVITGRGRLALLALDLLASIVTPLQERRVEHIKDLICAAAEKRGLSCKGDKGVFDLVIAGEGRRIGLHFSPCSRGKVLRDLGYLLDEHLNDLTEAVIACTGPAVSVGLEAVGDVKFCPLKGSTREEVEAFLEDVLRNRGNH